MRMPRAHMGADVILVAREVVIDAQHVVAHSAAAHKDVSPGTLRPRSPELALATELSLTSNTVSRVPNADTAI
jgi:hypothetical protein